MAPASPKLNILVSYVYMTSRLCGLLLKHQSDIRLLIDSGAFTVWKAGKRISLKDYMNFLRKLPIEPWRYFTLDVIGDGRKTWDNYQRMLDEGFKPVPIFTRGEDFSMLDKYYETSDLVAIGGLVGTPGNKGYVKRIMREVGDRKVHWLGFCQMNYLRYFAPYSCDSATWNCRVRFKDFALYTQEGHWRYIKQLQRRQSELEQLFNEYGENIGDLKVPSLWRSTGTGRNFIERIPCKAWVRCSSDLSARYKIQLFLVVSAVQDLAGMVAAMRFWRQK